MPSQIQSELNKSFILNYTPIFSRLKKSQKRLIERKSQIVSYKKGDFIYRQAEPADAFYCVVTGRVKIFRSKDNKEEDLEFLTCGMYFGILSLLTAREHSVSAQAINDSLILKIKKDDFEHILRKIPRLAIDLSATLSRQIRNQDYKKDALKSNIISVYSAVRGIGRTMYSVNLAISLSKETKKKVIFVEISHSGKEVLEILDIGRAAEPVNLKYPGIQKDLIHKLIIKNSDLGTDFLNIAYNIDTDAAGDNIGFILSLLTEEYKYVIVDLPIEKTEAVFKALTQSDAIHLLTDYDTDNLRLTRELMTDLFKNVEYPQEKIKVIVNEKKNSQKIPHDDIVHMLDHGIFADLPVFWQATEKISRESVKIVLTSPGSEYAKAVRRISRQIGNMLVGLVLSSGGAMGLAEIGVIKVLERENIPIDIVAGASMGALIAALWASGKSGEDIEKIMMEYNRDKKKVFRLLFDFSLSASSIAEGRRLTEFLRSHLGNKTFYDVKLPLKIIACDLNKRGKIILDSGDLTDAVKESIAIPGVFRPIKLKDILIVDGGILEPLPVDTLRDIGIKKIIAVNVLPSPQDVEEGFRNYKYALEKEKLEIQKKNIFIRAVYNLRMFFRSIFFPNIFDIMVKSMLSMEYAMAKESCQRAGVVISPVLAGTDWYEFFKTEVIVKKGEEDAEKALPQIRALIEH